MSSQFDDLLLDLGGDSSGGATIKTTPNGDNSELLLDFEGSSQVTNGQVSSNGVNPLYDLDTSPQQQPQTSSNPLYDLDFSEDTPAAPDSSNPLYEFENTATPAASDPEPIISSDPFQGFESLGEGEPQQDSSADLLSGTDAPDNQGGTADLLGDFGSEPQVVEEANTMQEGDSGIQSEHNGSSSLLDGFTSSGVTITTQEQDQPEDEIKEEEQEEEPSQSVTEEQVVEEEKQPSEHDDVKEDDVDNGAGAEVLPDLVVKEEGDDEEVLANQEEALQSESSHVDEVAQEEEQPCGDETQQEEIGNDEAEPEAPREEIRNDEAEPEALQEETRNDEAETEAPQEETRNDEAEPEAPQEETRNDEAEPEAPQETRNDEADPETPQEETRNDEAQSEAPQEETPDDEAQPEEQTREEDEYPADRTEEDLEQYCIDREEERSEVSEEAGTTDDGAGLVPSKAVEEEQLPQHVEEDMKNDEAEGILEEQSQEEEVAENVDQVNVEDGDVVDEVDKQQDERDQISTQEEVVEESHEETSQAPEEEAASAPEVEGDNQEDSAETVVPEPSEREQEVAADADLAEEDVQQVEDAVQQQQHEQQDDAVDETPEEQPAEADEPLQVTTTSSTDDSPYHTQDTVVEDSKTETQETTSDQWPPKDSIDQPQVVQETPAINIQEDQTPAKHVEEKQQEVMSSQVKQPQTHQEWEDEEEEEEEEGVYENEPVRRDDIVRESDKTEDTNLPSPGLAQNLLAKFNTGTASNSTPRSKREITPPNPTMGGGEYVSEPRVVLERYEGKADSGVFESEPQRNPEVVTSDSHLNEALPEQGSAKKFAARYAQIDQEGKTTVMTTKKEITTDRDSGPVEYVSEPRGFVEHYEGKADSGVFESQPEDMPDVVKSGEKLAQDAVPERGTAKNLAQRFHQISIESASPVASSTGRNKRELTPDQSGRTEYVSEPRSQVESYQSKVESGVFENTPMEDSEAVKSQTAAEEYVPERGYAKNVAAKFKELENTAKSPPLSPGRRKEFTPPREDQATSRTSGIYESTPESKPDVVTSSESQQEVLPGAGTAKSLAQRYKEIEAQNQSPVTSKQKKEITPPPNDAGVFENKPERFQADYNRPAESGILENTPAQRDDVLRGSDSNTEVELPEAGSARNLVSKWRQIESESAKNTSPGSAGRHKEFTPPREEPRIMQNSKSPRTPKSPMADGSGHQLDNGAVHPSELPGQYQPQNEPHVFESTPEANPDALREADTDKSVGLPKKNQAKKMLARFQSIEAQANKESPKPVPKKQQESDTTTGSSIESEDAAMEATRLKFEDPEQVGRSKSMRAAVQVEKCGACDKTVYAMERLEMNKRVYHRACFRCSQCKAVLTPKTFAINNEVIFCTTHYKQNFTTKGNYDEGFGRQQHKKHWNSNPNISNSGATTTNGADDDKS